MPVVTSLNWNMSESDYDRLRAEAGWLEEPPSGGRLHIAWFTDGQLHALDVWDSAEALQKYVESDIMPAARKVGITTDPTDVTAHPAYEVFVVGER